MRPGRLVKGPCVSARISFSSSAASLRAGPALRPRSRPGWSASAESRSRRPRKRLPATRRSKPRPPTPGRRAAGSSLSLRSTPSRSILRPRLPRHRRLDRRFHRRPAGAGRGEGRRRRCRPRAARPAPRGGPARPLARRRRRAGANCDDAWRTAGCDRHRCELYFATACASARAQARRRAGVARQPDQAPVRTRPRRSRQGPGHE